MLSERGYVSVAPGVFLGQEMPPTDDDMLIMSGQNPSLPAWVREVLLPDRVMRDYAAFEQALSTAQRALNGVTPGPIETMVLRSLIVHGWRRLVLRHPPLPDEVFSTEWRGPACRELVRNLLDQLGKPPMGAAVV